MTEYRRIGIDTSKAVFTLHGVDQADRPTLRTDLRRAQLLSFLRKQPATEIVLEACGGSHHWARELGALGHRPPDPATTTQATARLRVTCGPMHGAELAPLDTDGARYTFLLPPGAAEVHVLSRSGSPADLAPWRNDHRRLGVAVSRIVLRDAAGELVIPADHPALVRGWHPVERSAGAFWRWTDGKGQVTLPDRDGAAILELHLTGGMIYCLGESGTPARQAA